MENRDRDGNVNRNTSQQSGKKQSDVDFGKNIGRSEDLEEPDRHSGSDIGSSDRSSSRGDRSPSGSMGSSEGSRRLSGGSEE